MKLQKEYTIMQEIKNYNIVVGYEIDNVSDVQVGLLNKALSSKFRATKDQMNSTPDITCQNVWHEELDENNSLSQMGFENILFIGFNGIGSAEFPNGGSPEINTYSVPVVLLDGTIESMESGIDKVLDEDIQDAERVILTPREHGVSF